MRVFLIMIVLLPLGSQVFVADANCGEWQETSRTIEPVGLITGPEELYQPLADDQAVVWYTFHMGYAVKTKTKLLIFDYVRGLWLNEVQPPDPSIANGWIDPAEISSLDVYVFVTHSHEDHYDPIIMTWQQTVPNITYFFGWPESGDAELQTAVTSAATLGSEVDIHYMAGPRASFIDDNFEVYTINSYHSGVPEVAYLVKTDGLALYHGGDYNEEYEVDMAYLKTKANSLDFAFLMDYCGPNIMEVMEVLTPKIVFAGHFGSKELEPRRLPTCVEDSGLPCIVKCPIERGQMFEYGEDSKIAFYSSRAGRDDIYLMNTDGSDVQLVTQGEYGGKCPDISADEQHIVFVTLRDGNSEIYTVDLVSHSEQRLTALPSVERQPEFSPDGSRIVFQSNRDGPYDIYLMDVDGSDWIRLTATEAEELWPTWSPDGQKIAFNSMRDGNWELYIVNTDGTGLQRLTNSDDWETNPAWSPDGTRLAFRSGPPAQFQGDIHVINIDGTNENKLTDIDGVEENPEWSPDGTHIAFQTMKDGNFEIYVMEADGSNWQNLTNHSAGDYWPSWSAACNCVVWGDVDGSSEINPVDVVYMVNYVYKNQNARVQPPNCPYQAGDVNCDESVNPVDVVYYVNFVYKSAGEWPCLPCAPLHPL